MLCEAELFACVFQFNEKNDNNFLKNKPKGQGIKVKKKGCKLNGGLYFCLQLYYALGSALVRLSKQTY